MKNTKKIDLLNNDNDENQHIDSLLPIEKLSFDIWNNIIIYLSLRERLRCIQVCKICHSYILSSPNMWAELSSKDIKLCTIFSQHLVPYKINGKNVRAWKDSQDFVNVLIGLACSNIRKRKHPFFSAPGEICFIINS